MKEIGQKKQGEAVFENEESKKVFRNALKYLALALPLLFASPIVVTIGFKIINKGGSYLTLILGCIMTLVTIVLVIQAIRHILKSLFNK